MAANPRGQASGTWRDTVSVTPKTDGTHHTKSTIKRDIEETDRQEETRKRRVGAYIFLPRLGDIGQHSTYLRREQGWTKYSTPKDSIHFNRRRKKRLMGSLVRYLLYLELGLTNWRGTRCRLKHHENASSIIISELLFLKPISCLLALSTHLDLSMHTIHY